MRKDFLEFLKQRLDSENNFLILKNEIGYGSLDSPRFGSTVIFPEIKRAIKAAEHQVLICGYKLEANSDGEDDLIEALQALSAKAVEANRIITVRILINRRKGLASFFQPNPPSYNNRLRHFSENQFRNLDFQYAEHEHFAFGAYHGKEFILDDSAYLCSGDIGLDHNYKHGEQGWRELLTGIHGTDIVQHIREDFISAWNSSHTKPLKGKKKPIATHIDAPILKPNNALPILYLAKKANGNPFKQSHLGPYTTALITAIEQAEERIDIMTVNLNVPAVIKALADANQRGVEINILIGKHNNDKEEKQFFCGGPNLDAIFKLYDEIFKRGSDNLYKLNIHWVAINNKILLSQDPQTLHAKLICIDDVLMCGSSLPDNQSAFHSREDDIVVQSVEKTREYRETIFQPLFDQGVDFKNVVEESYRAENLSRRPSFR